MNKCIEDCKSIIENSDNCTDTSVECMAKCKAKKEEAEKCLNIKTK